MENITFREGLAADAQNLYKCNKTVLPLYYYPDDYKNFAISNKHCIIVAEYCNMMIGYLVGEISSDNIHIVSFGIYPLFRKKGVGSGLVDYLKNMFKKNKYKSITLNVHVENKAAIIFYMKNSFKIYKKLPNYYTALNATNRDGLLMLYLIN